MATQWRLSFKHDAPMIPRTVRMEWCGNDPIMAEADLDVVIRQIAKAQNKTLMAAVKKRRDQIMARAAKAKDKEARNQFRLIAKSTMELGTAAAKRLQNSAENTADSYLRAIRGAAEEAAATVKKAAAKPPRRLARKKNRSARPGRSWIRRPDSSRQPWAR